MVDDRRQQQRSDSERSAFLDVVYMLARASEAHDEDTGAHVLRIREIVERIALEMAIDPLDAEMLGFDAMLHDVGKLMIPQSILSKPGQLDDDERLQMESHTTLGAKMLADRPSMFRAGRIARWHHERWDGKGYPDGLMGLEIPIEARITAVADVFDALIAERSYKACWSVEEAVAEVSRLAGTHLDPTAAAALNAVFERGELADVLATG